MLNKRQVYQLLRDRVWVLQYFEKNMLHPIFISTIPKTAFLSFIFRKNGRIEIPTDISFVPNGYSGWNFDEANQEILFTNENGNPIFRTSLPKELPYGITALKMAATPSDDSIYFYVSYFHLSSSYVSEQFLGGTKAFFLPRSVYTSDFYNTLRWTGFNTNLVDHEDSQVAMFTEIYEYLAYHPQIAQVIFSRTNQPVVQLPKRQQLLFSLEGNQPSLVYFSGTRAAIMELLALVITENNLRLYNDVDQRSETEMLQDVITTCFAGRYEVSDSFPEAASLWEILLNF